MSTTSGVLRSHTIHPGTLLAEPTTDECSAQDILDLHAKKKQEFVEFDGALTEIVAALGGTDEVIRTCLRSGQYSVDQLQKLHQIINTPQSNFKPSITLRFCAEDIWSAVSPSVQKWTYHKGTMSVMFIIGLLGYVVHQLLRNSEGDNGDNSISMTGNIVDIVINCLVVLPYLTLISVCMNPDAFNLLQKSFDFKIKIIYAFLWGCTFFILDMKTRNNGNGGQNVVANIQNVTVALLTIMLVTVIASLDAIPKVTRTFKVSASVVVALYFTWRAFVYQFLKDQSEDYVIHITATDSVISFHALLASFTRVLAIFMWKQGVNAFRKNGRCISITHIPYIEYEDKRQRHERNKPDKEHMISSITMTETAKKTESPRSLVEDNSGDEQDVFKDAPGHAITVSAEDQILNADIKGSLKRTNQNAIPDITHMESVDYEEVTEEAGFNE